MDKDIKVWWTNSWIETWWKNLKRDYKLERISYITRILVSFHIYDICDSLQWNYSNNNNNNIKYISHIPKSSTNFTNGLRAELCN